MRMQGTASRVQRTDPIRCSLKTWSDQGIEQNLGSIRCPDSVLRACKEQNRVPDPPP